MSIDKKAALWATLLLALVMVVFIGVVVGVVVGGTPVVIGILALVFIVILWIYFYYTFSIYNLKGRK